MKSGLRALSSVVLTALWMAGCGGGLGWHSEPVPQKATPALTVTPPAGNAAAGQTLTVTVNVTGSTGTPTGTVTLANGAYTSAPTELNGGSASITVPGNTLTVGAANLVVTYTPDAASAAAYHGVTVSTPVMVMAIVPAVSVTPDSNNISTTQASTVTVTVAGSGAEPIPTGSVTLASGSYTSAATPLANGSASVAIPAGVLAKGTNTLTANYAPDTAGAAIYGSATGTGTIDVSLAAPVVTVTPGSNNIGAAQALTVTVAVSGAGATPTGSVTLTSGGYTSAATALNNGSASIDIPAGSLAGGNDTLTASYTPNAASAAIYSNATGSGSVTVAATYTLTLASAAPASGITISAAPADLNGKTGGTTPFTLSYGAGTQVTLSAPDSDNGYQFVSWTGCGPATGTSTETDCATTVNSNTTVTAAYNQTGVTSVTITPNAATVGTQQLFTATVNGTGSFSNAVTWRLSCPNCGNLSQGDFAATTATTALYNTPYPAPASVTITATSQQNTAISDSVTVSLNPPSTTAGPALAVDVNTPNTPSENPHSISPYVYGMNAYALDATSEKIANPGLLRWGGDDTSRYNYQNGWTNSASDYYFENGDGAAFMFPDSTGGENFTQFFPAADTAGAAALGTVPVLGWVSNGASACSFTQSAYPGQQSYNGSCGNGVYAKGSQGCTTSGGCDLYGSNAIAAITSTAEPPPNIADASATPSSTQVPNPGSVTTTWAASTWSGGWVNSIVANSNYGNGASGKGVAIWDLDNEPTWWDAEHRDVHPLPFTYDEVTDNGIGTALAIKTADPTALVSGPVIDYWWAYFYSKKDIENGWSTGPCYEPWSNPTDRAAHGGTALMDYYLQQFQKYSQQYGIRLLDYVDIHGYFAPDYPAGSGNSVAFTTAGDTQEQETRMNGTRVFWDPTYTDPNYPRPNYSGAPAASTNCSPALQAPELIPMLKNWVASDYPGTRTAIDEYNFGGDESINGAVTQADILGIFGRQGLDLGAFWPAQDYNTQEPGNFAFAMFRNYDGNDSTFGDTYLYATSTAAGGGDGEGQLAVYGGQRSSDNAITVMVINKTYGALTSTISLENYAAPGGTTAQAYQYSSANLSAILTPGATPVTPPSGSRTASTIQYTFPAQSITLFVMPD